MVKFVLRKLLYGFLVLFGVITVVFVLFNVLPGDPALMMVGQRTDKASIDAINKDLGRDKPLFTQYIMYLNDLSFISVHETQNTDHHLYLDQRKYGDPTVLFTVGTKAVVFKAPYFRRSYQNRRPVSEIISETLPETIVLALAAMIFASVIGIALGIVCAVRKNSWIDRTVFVFASLGMAGPSFFIALIISYIFGFLLTDYTGLSNIGSLFTTPDFGTEEYLDLKNLILPAITLGIRPLALIIQLMRSSMLEVLSQDYVRTARAKGLSYYSVLIKHAMKNAMNPVVTSISGWFAGLMAGAAFVETVFNWKGIGYEVVHALQSYDLPVVMGTTLIFSTCFVLINIAVDITYGFLDPRVRLA
ncbi:MAG: dipeptide/oligopeptide/nickel ABC transporter permease [Bacteroidetes bacterium]|nr:MAG: dipeptide/oligopeptide/nickel ABC transporter permease [Bacteroidota bacterium]